MSDSAERTFHLDRRAHELLNGASTPAAVPIAYKLHTAREVADWLGVSTYIIDIWRMKGEGPPFVRVGPRYIRYRHEDVVDWLASRVKKRTSEYVKRPSEATEQPAAQSA